MAPWLLCGELRDRAAYLGPFVFPLKICRVYGYIAPIGTQPGAEAVPSQMRPPMARATQPETKAHGGSLSYCRVSDRPYGLIERILSRERGQKTSACTNIGC